MGAENNVSEEKKKRAWAAGGADSIFGLAE